MFLASVLLATTIAAQPLTIDDYATMPTIAAPQFSPDGRRIVYTATRADMTRSSYDSDLWIVDADGANDIPLTHSTGNDTHPRWSPDGTRIAFLSDRDAGRNAIWILNPNGGEPVELTKEPAPIREFTWSPDGKSIAFLMADPITAEEEKKVREKEDWHVIGQKPREQHLYIIDVADKAIRRMTCCEFSINGVAWSPDGKTLAVVRVPSSSIDNSFHSDLYTVDAKSHCDDRSCPSMLPLVVRPGIDTAPQFSPDGKSVAFLSAGGVFDWLTENQIWVVDLTTHKAHLASGAYDRTPETFHWSADSRAIWFDGAFNTTAELFRVNADGSGFTDVTKYEGTVEGADVAKNGLAAFVMQSLTTPPELYVADTNAKVLAPRQLTHHNDRFQNREIAPTRLIRWKNPKDGLEIEGLLTLPFGYKTGERVPLLTFVHGGPASHFDQAFLGYLGYLYAPQVLAQKGFAVLRPNPRGTGGYGQKFREANRNDWGGMDWVDINAGIDKVIADGIADPAHMGLMGWSYGGFMASWAIGHSDRLRAISVGAPVVDLLSFHGTTDIREFIPSYFPAAPATATGAPANAAEPVATTDAPTLEAMKNIPMSFDLLRAHSPIWQLHPTKAHVLIQQGEVDERVPLSQGIMLYRVLQEMGTDVTMVTYPRSHHVPHEPKERIDVMRRNVELFEKSVK